MDSMEKTGYWTVAFRAFIFFSINLLILAAAFYWWRLGRVPFETKIVFNPAHQPFYNPYMPPRLLYFAVATFFVGVSLLISLVTALYIKNNLFSRYKFFRNFFYLLLGLLLSFIVDSVWLAAFPLLMLAGALLKPKWIGLVPVAHEDGVPELYIKNIYRTVQQILVRYSTRISYPKKLAQCCNHHFQWVERYKVFLNFQCVGVIVWFCASICLIFLVGPKIWMTHKLLNPYIRVSNYYTINTPAGTFIMNSAEFVNGALMWGAHDKIDVANIDSWKQDSSCVNVNTNDSLLQSFVDKVNSEAYPEIGSFFTSSYDSLPMLFYGEGRLCIVQAQGSNALLNRKLNNELLVQLQKSTGQDFSAVAERINAANQSGILKFSDLKSSMTPELDAMYQVMGNYKSSTDWENRWQLTFRGDLKHQAYYILPIHEYLNGKPLDKIQHFYGVGYTVLGGELAKILSKDGQVSWGKTMRSIAAVTLVTFLIITLTTWSIFKDFRVISVCVLIYLFKNIAVGFESYVVSCGQVDLRVIFDFATLCSFYFYTRNSNLRNAMALLVLSGLAVGFFFEFGVAIILACSASLLILCIIKKHINKIDIFVLLTEIALLIFGYKLAQIGVRDISGYFIKGILASPLTAREIFLPLTVFSVYLIMFLYMCAQRSKYSILFLCSVFYAQIISVYYIWNGSYHHYISYALRHIFPIVIFGYFFFMEKIKENKWGNITYIIVVLLISINCLSSFSSFIREKKMYENSFQSQLTYRWKDKNTQFVTTMNKIYFDNAVSLIDKYLPPDEKGIFLISQYDQLLLFLSKKYTEMPAFDLAGYLLTHKENEKVISLINTNKPEFLFVDSDINSPYIFDIVSSRVYGSSLYKESLFRALSLTELSNVFQDVRNDYELIERSELISVYKRREKVL